MVTVTESCSIKGGDNLPTTLAVSGHSLLYNFVLLPSGVNLSGITHIERHVPISWMAGV